ncbi:MAG TPA: non-homologous end-joining DNA ligase [Symbiobacteriaceae bacterium]|nr:non-homologous end-joining DNA ligase [Symbiobacteriaceae bacterium]
MATVRTQAAVAGRTLALSNLDKPLWPEDGITKAELIDYYTRMAPYLLPYLKGRPLVLTRYPDGIRGKWFYHKDAPPGTPDWVPTWPFRAEDDRILHFLVAEEPATLAFVANLGAIELHPWLSRCATPDSPDWAVIDLDPSEGCTFEEVVVLARLVRQLLAAVQIHGFPKLSGATGIHIYCPCGPGYMYGETAAFCEAIGRVLLKVYPQKVTLERVVAKRTGKIYVDYLQNRRGQTITSVYGVRPMAGAPVSAPVTWEELEGTPPRFSIRTIWQRLAEVGDMFNPILTMTQDLRRATAELRSML